LILLGRFGIETSNQTHPDGPIVKSKGVGSLVSDGASVFDDELVSVSLDSKVITNVTPRRHRSQTSRHQLVSFFM